MILIRGMHNLRPRHRGCVATIGNFDGVHQGHQAVFRHLLAKGAEYRLPDQVITFEPQPQEYFAPQVAPARLTRLREKLQALQETGLQRVLLLEFNARLAAMDATDFVREVLVDGLGIRFLLVGDDFRFGRDRRGDYRLLCDQGREQGFAVEDMNTFRLNRDRVSSTRIREALTQGDLTGAAALLGRPYCICGRVGHGAQRGRTLGFPTANIDLHRRVSPVHGVVAVWVRGLKGGPRPGVANIGSRPTISGASHDLLEVHLLDFAGNLYGTHLQVELVARLRNEMRFGSVVELRHQIVRDAEQARLLLSGPTPDPI
jgi:riboflavin kinase/FMN adenylyltransferase